jgi:hypothetical protein
MNRLSLLLLLCASGAQAAVIGDFQQEFAPNSGNWTMTPDQGTIAFNGSSSDATALTITGPTGNFNVSADAVTFTTPAVVGGSAWLVNFQWTFSDAEDSGATAELISSTLSSPDVLASTGEGATGLVTLGLAEGDTLEFLLISDPISEGKIPPALVIDDFTFTAVPEPGAAPWIVAFLTLPVFGGPLWQVLRRKISG